MWKKISTWIAERKEEGVQTEWSEEKRRRHPIQLRLGRAQLLSPYLGESNL